MNDTSSSRPVALVTGAARGIGLAIANALAETGHAVAFHYRQESHAEAARLWCETHPGSRPFAADLASESACQDLIQRVKTEMGGLHVLVNNAGMCVDQIIQFAKPEDMRRLIDTNLMPVFTLTKLSSKIMARQRQGAIINITSVVGHTGNMGQSMYASTKAAIHALTQSTAQDLASFGVRVNSVAPGFIETDMTRDLPEKARETILSKVPMQRLGRPEEVGSVVAFLASDKASYITGTAIHVNGGMYTG
jgi:3-oxoacyl-[acyl-carrier protein] reductase